MKTRLRPKGSGTSLLRSQSTDTNGLGQQQQQQHQQQQISPNNSNCNTNKASSSSSSPSPSAACKRPASSNGPTRVLPKRACSLLVTPPPPQPATSQRSNHPRRAQQQSILNKATSTSSSTTIATSTRNAQSKINTSNKSNTNPAPQQLQQHQQQQPSEASTRDRDVDDGNLKNINNNNSNNKNNNNELEFPPANKTANPKNYSREVPVKLKALPPTLPTANTLDKNQIDTNKPVVRIELPESQISNGDSTRITDTVVPDDQVDKLSSTPKGPKRLGSSILAPVEATLRTTPTILNLAPPKETTTSTGNNINHVQESSSIITTTTTNTTATSSFNLSTTPNRLPPNQVILAVKEKNFNIIVAVTGSVATIKLIELVKRIQSMFPRVFISKQNGITYQASVNLRIVMTENSKHFMPKSDLKKALNDTTEIFDDSDEWAGWKKIGDPVLHIELRKWADLLLIAPLDANTLAKLSNGICDNLLSCIVRAWDTNKPLIYCPAMNVHMYDHPLTRQHFCKLQSFGYLRVDCIEKRLACGDVGMGGMASVETIADKVVEALIQPISRSTTMTRPLLNQQPTYPIISTSAHYEKQLNTNSGRINSNQQRSGTGASTICLITDNLRRQKLAQQANSIQFLDKIPRNNNGSNNNPAHTKSQPGAVTSVQNLRAINYASDPMDIITKTIQDGIRSQYDPISLAQLDDNNGSSPQYDNSEFDPANLLEQSMTIGEAFPVATGSNGLPSSNKNDLSKYNSTQLLALCYNKQRDCFTCAVCGHDYKNRKSMARHLKEQHVQGNIFHCRPCGVSFKRREKLIKHNRDRHSSTNVVHSATNVV